MSTLKDVTWLTERQMVALIQAFCTGLRVVVWDPVLCVELIRWSTLVPLIIKYILTTDDTYETACG
jgi:hypothetical protein